MLDSIIERFKQRRAERLAQRGYNIKKKQYRKSDGEIKISKREILKNIEHFDEPEEESTEGWNKYQARRGQPRDSGGSVGGHGNTRLPFGLCKRYGIEIGAGWTPRDAWDALAGKGITAEGAYRRLKEGKDPGELDNPVDTTGGTEEGTTEEAKPEEKKPVDYFTTDKGKKVTDLKTDYYGWSKSRYRITGALEETGDYRYRKSFETKGDMYLFLKDMGVEQITDPETGEIVNPTEMEFPELIFKSYAWDDKSYTAPSIGMRDGKYAVVAKDLDGKSKVLETAGTFADAKDFLIRHGVPEDKIKLSPALKKREKERTAWLTSDKQEFFESDGVRYGDIRVKRDSTGGWELEATSEDGRDFWKPFVSKMSAIKFLKDNGVQNGKVDGEFINPQEVEVPEIIAHIGRRDFQKLFYDADDITGRISLYGIDIDGDRLRITGISGYESFANFQKRITDSYSTVTLDKIEASEEIQKKIDEKKKQDEEKERRKAEFASKAVTIRGKRCADLEMELDSRGRPYLSGYDSDGDKLRIYYASKPGEMIRELERAGVSLDSVKMEDNVKERFNEYERIKRIFDQKAVEIAGTKYVDPEIIPTGYGSFVVTGYDEYGDGQTIMDASSMGDVVRTMTDLGVDVDSLIKRPEVREAYEKYKKFVEEFDKKAIQIYGDKYADLELKYKGGTYILVGKDIKGRERQIDYSRKPSELREKIEQSGGSMDAVSMNEETKKAYDRKMKEYKAIESGEYHEIDDCAFKNVNIYKVDNRLYVVKGHNIDGDEIDIHMPMESLDDAMEFLESRGIADYKVFNRRTGEELKKPEDGMRRIRMMRTPDGQFKIMATVGKSDTKEVHSAGSEEEARQWLREKGVDDSNVKTRGMNPNDDVPRTHTAKSLSNFDTYRTQAVENSFIDDLTDEEKKDAADMLTDIFNSGKYRCARSTGSMYGILTQGYKSQIETGTGGHGAAKTKSGRKSVSEKMYGHDSMKDDEYEKCGYLGLDDEEEDYEDSGHPFYGGRSNMTYTFKKDTMKDRVTYTYGDSLNTEYSMCCAGYAGDKPTIEGISSLGSKRSLKRAIEAYKSYKNGDISYTEMFERIRRDANNEYIELQYHGPVTAADIDTISFPNERNIKNAFDKMNSKQRKEAISILRNNGIKVIFRKDDGEPFVDAWDWIRQRYPDDV